MRGKKRITIDQGLATIIGGVLTFAGAISAAIIGISCVSKNSDLTSSLPDSDYSESSSSSSDSASNENVESSGSNVSFEDSGTNVSQPNASSGSSDQSSQSNPPVDSEINGSSSEAKPEDFPSAPEPSEPSSDTQTNKIYLLSDENGRVELFDDHSGIAYIYKKYLDENPVGIVSDVNDDCILIGWALGLFCYGNNEKSLTFHVTTKDTLKCTAQYDINGMCQNIYLEQIYVDYEENGDLRIEFNIDMLPFDLRDSSEILIMRVVEEIAL